MCSSSCATGLSESHEEQRSCSVGNTRLQLSKYFFGEGQKVAEKLTLLLFFCLNRCASTPAAGSSQDSVALILDCIKSAVRFQKTISEAWLKVCSQRVNIK